MERSREVDVGFRGGDQGRRVEKFPENGQRKTDNLSRQRCTAFMKVDGGKKR